MDRLKQFWNESNVKNINDRFISNEYRLIVSSLLFIFFCAKPGFNESIKMNVKANLIFFVLMF